MEALLFVAACMGFGFFVGAFLMYRNMQRHVLAEKAEVTTLRAIVQEKQWTNQELWKMNKALWDNYQEVLRAKS
jgi:hypothetical protein